MKARAVSYGAVELKQMEHRYMAVGLTFSVAIHICVIAAYFFRGLLIVDAPPIPPARHPLPHPDWGISIDPIYPPPGIPPLKHGGSKPPGVRLAIPVPVPFDPANEDTLVFKSGDPGPGGDREVGAEPGGEGEDTGIGPVGVEEEPPPFVPVEREPVLMRKVEPVYPELAIRAGLEGKVWVKIWVDREGRAHKAEVTKSTSEIFNESTLAAAMKCAFVPAYMNGGPVAVWVSIPYTFKLR
jgi:TonB family protein